MLPELSSSMSSSSSSITKLSLATLSFFLQLNHRKFFKQNLHLSDCLQIVVSKFKCSSFSNDLLSYDDDAADALCSIQALHCRCHGKL